MNSITATTLGNGWCGKGPFLFYLSTPPWATLALRHFSGGARSDLSASFPRPPRTQPRRGPKYLHSLGEDHLVASCTARARDPKYMAVNKFSALSMTQEVTPSGVPNNPPPSFIR